MKKLILFLALAFTANAFAQQELTDSLTVLNKDVTLNYFRSGVMDDGSTHTISLVFVMKNKASYKSIYYYGRRMNKAQFSVYNKINDTHWLGIGFRTGKSAPTPKAAFIKLYYTINKKTKELEIALTHFKIARPKRMPSRPLPESQRAPNQK